MMLLLNTSGSQNTAIGYQSLFNNTSGINNTALGYNTFSASTINNSTAIGYDSNPTKSNQVVIGTVSETVYIPGNVGIQTDTPLYALDINGNASATAFYSTSDYRMKDNIQPLLDIRIIDQLKPVEYDFVDGSHDMGFLAHEVQEIFPFLVTNEKDGENMQALNYTGIIAVLVKEIQDLKKEMKMIKQELFELKNLK